MTDRTLFRWLLPVLALSLLAAVLLLPGCAPRLLQKTPLTAMRYPYLPVDAKDLANYRALVSIQPKDTRAAEAYFWIAQDAFNRGRWEEAARGFLKVQRQFPRSPWAPAAVAMVARCRVKQQRPLDALALLRPLTLQAAPAEAEEAGRLAASIINDELSPADLAAVQSRYPDTPWAEQALFVAGKRLLDAGQIAEASACFQELQRRYPRSAFAPMARDLAAKATRLVPVHRNRVGCLLPLTGPFAPYGKTLQQGLELALADINARRGETERLGLVVADSLGTTEGALAGLRHLADVEKVMLVIGPALSSSARALLPELGRLRLVCITPSAADPDLVDGSPYFFRYMLTNEAQGEAMAEYVVSRRGLKRVGILNGQDPYDRALAEAFERRVAALGGEVVERAEFPRGTTDFRTQMLALGGVDPGLMKDQGVQERKKIEQAVDALAYQASELIAPSPNEPDATPTPGPVRRVAILRFVEEGEVVQQEELGRELTEKCSYALAPKPGVKVLTQRETEDTLRRAGLSPEDVTLDNAALAASALDVDYLILGVISQVQENFVLMPGQPIPLRFEAALQLVAGRSGRVVKDFKVDWTRSLAPEVNVKSLEAVYLPVPAGEAILAASQLAFYDLKVQVFGCDAWLTPMLLRRGSEALDGAVLATGFWPDEPKPRIETFVNQFEGMFSARPTLLAVQAYDALSLAAEALRRLSGDKPERDDVQRELLRVRTFEGVTGAAVIEGNGEIHRQPLFLEIRNGKLKRVQ